MYNVLLYVNNSENHQQQQHLRLQNPTNATLWYQNVIYIKFLCFTCLQSEVNLALFSCISSSSNYNNIANFRAIKMNSRVLTVPFHILNMKSFASSLHHNNNNFYSQQQTNMTTTKQTKILLF